MTAPGSGVSQRLNGSAYGGMAQAGLRLGSPRFFVEPAVSIDYARSDIARLAAGPNTLDPDQADGLRGRAGARIGTETISGATRTTFYLSGNAVHEFKGRDHLLFTSNGQSADLGGPRLGTYGRGTLGVNIVSDERVSGFIEAYGDIGETYKGGGGRAGLSVRF